MNEVHFFPDDMSVHTEDADCPCLPEVEYVPSDRIYGSGWIYRHNLRSDLDVSR